MGMIKEFKEFAMKGNVVDMAVGIVIGAAFGKIVSSFVSDVIMPPLGMLLGHLDFSNLMITLARNRWRAGGRGDSLRRVHQHGRRFHDRGVRRVSGHQASQSLEADRCPAAAVDQGLPLLQGEDSVGGHALRALHFRSEVTITEAFPACHRCACRWPSLRPTAPFPSHAA